jgi:site-specific DNA recombinase
MRIALTYGRVSTDGQERDGTSLESQQQACLKLATELGYDVPERFTVQETYSGLTLDRPRLNEVRQWVRDGEVQVVVAYTLDRLSRDPVHFIILQEEMKRAGVEIILATESLDNSDMGKLISHIKGYAAKLEVEKIKERTGRGTRTRAELGMLPNGRGGRLYGYLYMQGKGEGRGIRIPNEDEAEVVRRVFSWLLEEGLSINAITKRLRLSSNRPPESAPTWGRSSVYAILKNPAYCGKTYVFRETRVKVEADGKAKGHRPKATHQQRPKDKWMEIPNATPPIISEDVFNAAQERLQRNRDLAKRNTKRDYLLRGLVKCRACGRNYVGTTSISRQNGNVYQRSYYRCGARNNLSPVKCYSRLLRADYLDGAVWEQIESLLAKPEIILAEVQRKQEQTGDIGVLERNLERTRLQLANREKQKTRTWKAFEITGDEETFKQSIGQLRGEVETLQREESRLQQDIAANVQFTPDPQDVKKACEMVRQNLNNLSLEDKRQAMDILQVKVWIDASTVAIEGTIPVPEVCIASRSLT